MSLRSLVAYAHDIVMAAASFVLSLYLRLGGEIATYPVDIIAEATGAFALVAAAVFLPMGLYRGIWRYASINDLVAIARAATLTLLVFLPVMFLLTRLEHIPRSSLVINWFVLMGLLGGPRLLYRLLKDRRLSITLDRDAYRRVPTLLIGAGDGADLFIREMGRSREALYRVVGVLDERGTRAGRRLRGVPVLAMPERLSDVVEDLARRGDRPERLVLTRETIDRALIARLLEEADELGLSLARMPRVTDFKAGLSDGLEVKPIAIEDLLGRPQAALDRAGMRALIAGKRVLVTGAGGTIGAELVRQISDFAPAEISLLDHSEYALYAVDLELSERHPGLPRRALLADVRERRRAAEAIAGLRPELVFHAAALKHVPIVEAHPVEGVLTNVVGSRNVADACRAAGAAAMVLISTDKAVNPASVMGATKRIAEAYCQALDLDEAARADASGAPRRTRFITVRFGNVLGSTGSVVPLFQRQLARGGPLTVTHPQVERYFMTVREAVELVLQATVLGSGEGGAGSDHRGKIFVLDMGEPVRILDLARQIIRLAGLTPDKDIAIRFTGLRPGEKLNEQIFHGAEPLIPTASRGLLLAAPRTADFAVLSRAIDALEETCRGADPRAVREQLARLVPEFRPAGTGAESTPLSGAARPD
ncbi:MAG: polysaccharide biosynthesis protein [Proteobacteria bacterium]|nr:polysaccharide biosynthesis protein [Pseudomonadota bacterium]